MIPFKKKLKSFIEEPMYDFDELDEDVEVDEHFYDDFDDAEAANTMPKL